MDTIYNLQKRAEELRNATATDSVTPEQVGGLHADTLDYIADMEQNAEGLGIHRVYASHAAMTAEGEAPTGTNGKRLRYGQLVAVYDKDTEQEENGNVYAWQKGTGEAAWLLMGRMGGIQPLKASIEEEAAARKDADAAIEGRLNTVQTAVEAEAAARKEADEAMAAEKGAAGGVAPLDDEGKVAEGYLADEWTGEVLEFAGTVSGVSAVGAGVTDTSGAAVYDTTAKIFVYALQGAGATGLATVKYYGYWPGADKYGKFADGGMSAPYRGKLYVDTTTEKVYRWNGTELVEVSGNLELERKLETYIRQNNELVGQTCKDLEIAEQDIDRLQGEIDALDKFAVMSEAEYEALSDKDDGTFYMITED